MKRIIAAVLVLIAGVASVAATQNWLATVERTPVSHIVGNPDAPVTLTEYLSYTCPHCRDFTMTGEQALKLGYVQSGKLRYEYRHAIANPADLAATMLARCGDPDKFPGNHAALMAAQPQINGLRQMATKSQTDRWNFGDKSARRRAVASDLGLYGVFERRGYTRVELDQCLNDQDLADRRRRLEQDFGHARLRDRRHRARRRPHVGRPERRPVGQGPGGTRAIVTSSARWRTAGCPFRIAGQRAYPSQSARKRTVR